MPIALARPSIRGHHHYAEKDLLKFVVKIHTQNITLKIHKTREEKRNNPYDP